MGLSLTDNTLAALAQAAKEPNIVLKIDGIARVFGAQLIKKYVRFGDGSEFGDPESDPDAFYIGGMNLVANQDNLITLDGSSTSIKQTLNTDKGQGASITSLQMALIDDGYATELITPGAIVDDMLQRQCLVYMGFNGTAWPDDYVVIFRGLVTEILADPGKVTLTINSPDDKKRTNIYKKLETKLSSTINSSTTSIATTDKSYWLRKKAYPTGVYDSSVSFYFRVDDEIIQYDTIDGGGNFTGIVRGALGTTAASHDAGATCESFYRLQGNGIDLALKLMASGFVDNPEEGLIQPFVRDYPVSSVNVGGAERYDNALFFRGVNINDELGLTIGDWVHQTRFAANAANNVNTPKQIVDIIRGEAGDFIIVDDVSYVDETATETFNIGVSFTSQYSTLPDGCRMTPSEIDVEEHLRLKRLFLSSVEYDFYIKDGIDDAKEFIEQQIYKPMAAYSLPRKARASIGYHIGPIPGTNIQTFNETNVKNPTRTQLKRSTNKNFWNEIIYKYDEDALEDKFFTGYITISADSKTRIPGANRTMVIEAKGMRTSLSADNIAQAQGLRRLKRYEFGSETVVIETTLESAYAVEVGDIVVFDGSQLQLPDIKTGQKGMAPRFFEIANKDLTIKTGAVRLELIDTKFDGAARYGLIAPASFVKSGLSTTQFIIEESFASRFLSAEYRKWKSLRRCSVRVRNSDFSQVDDSVIISASSNTITVSPALSFTPSAGMIMELTAYDDADVTDQVKLIYGHMRNSAFADGQDQFKML